MRRIYESARAVSTKASAAALLIALAMAGAGTAEAQEPFVVPPAPEAAPPGLAGELRADVVFPAYDDPICPSGRQCVFRSGGGFGGSLELRWPRGLAAGVALDFWFFNGRTVEELPTLQVLSAQVRHFFFSRRELHPFVGGAVGGALFGDRLRIDTAGLSVDGFVGVEAERSARVAFSGAIGVRAFGVAPFTSADGTARAGSFFANVAVYLRFGLVLQRF